MARTAAGSRLAPLVGRDSGDLLRKFLALTMEAVLPLGGLTALLVMIAFAFFWYKALTRLSRASGERLFAWSAWLTVTYIVLLEA